MPFPRELAPGSANGGSQNPILSAHTYALSPPLRSSYEDNLPEPWDLEPDLFGNDSWEPSLFVSQSPPAQPLPRQPTQHRTPPINQQQRGRSIGARSDLNSLGLLDPILEEFIEFGSSVPPSRSSSIVDLTEPAVVDLTSSPNMPASRKRKRVTDGDTPKKSSKTNQSNIGNSTTAAEAESVDLVDVKTMSEYEQLKKDKEAEALKQQQQDDATRPVKLSEFQCIICMDNPTDLTVTHCGHLFCSECLHEALHAGNNEKRSCPVCRTMINTSRIPDKRPPKNGYFHLEMKLMTRNRKGKQPQKVGITADD